ncbi:GNAT family N-acetyltransferase [Clostridia bacterium OttesenSCG-928-F22]|nr:GNAT family N-acetyltransferase [Clostridia bacterium OttesenSCG-928-F22]
MLDIWESAVEKTHNFLDEVDIAAIKPEVQHGLETIENLYCFCDDNDVMQGFIGVKNQKIEMLFVDAITCGKGVGKQLLEFALANLGAKYVDVNEQNEQGTGFYRHMGFIVLSRSDYDEQGRPFPILHLELNRA